MKASLLQGRHTLDQKTDRQRVDEKNYNLVIEDKCSGAVPFFERAGGIEAKNLIDNGVKFSLHVLTLKKQIVFNKSKDLK